MKKLMILGASGFGREVAWLVERINAVSPEWELMGFLDDNTELHGKMINGYPVKGAVEDAARFSDDTYFVCAVGATKVREKIIKKVSENDPGIRFATLVDPSVVRSDLVTVGKGSIICAHTILTVNIAIGDHVIINLDCTVGHDSVIHDFATLYPSVNVSGLCTIGRGCECGTGSNIIQGKTIGEQSIIGAGAVVVRDIPGHCTAVGCPAAVK